MILDLGDKLLLVDHRLFEQDHQRYFVGEVHAYDAGFAKVTGRSFVRNTISGLVLSKPEIRTKLVSLSSGTTSFYLLPKETNLQSLQFWGDGENFFLSDGENLQMNLAEIPERE